MLRLRQAFGGESFGFPEVPVVSMVRPIQPCRHAGSDQTKSHTPMKPKRPSWVGVLPQRFGESAVERIAGKNVDKTSQARHCDDDPNRKEQSEGGLHLQCLLPRFSVPITDCLSRAKKNGPVKRPFHVSPTSKSRHGLSTGGDCFHLRSCGLGFFAVRLLASLANVNTAFEERAIFDGDARCDYVTGQGTIAA